MNTHYTIYPIYLDSSRSYKKGRKYPLIACADKPKIEEIINAFKIMEIQIMIEPSKRHPKDPFIFGRIKVPKQYSKKSVLMGLKDEIEKFRRDIKVQLETKKEIVSEKKGYIKNDLNLVPKKKKKGKKGK
ncbi:signal recognition particle 19kDa [Gurleya vavrai]